MKRIWKKMMAILMAVFLVCTTLVLAGGAEAVSALAEAGGNTPEVTDGADAQQFADNSGDIIIGNISIELDQLIKTTIWSLCRSPCPITPALPFCNLV